jgi:alkaline phosphatase
MAAAERAKNVVLFIGDAGGIPTLHAASVSAYGDAGKLFVQHMPNIALSDTSSASEWVTDSAAGMTAIVTGHKTRNSVISQSASAVPLKEDGLPLKTVLEYAEEHGLSTGVVSNSSMADATPAACYAHSNSRKETAKIFAQILKPRFGDGVDVVIGHGRSPILKATQEAGLDIMAELAKAGFVTGESLKDIPEDARRAVILMDDSEHDLAVATDAAIRILSRNKKGFFLMVESDLHANVKNVPRGLERAVKFDKLIEATTQKMRKDSLVMFTADHSFDLRVAGKSPKGEPLYVKAEDGKISLAPAIVVQGHHSGEQVLVAADGPGSHRVRGFLSNTDLFKIIMDAYGWGVDKAAAAAGR